MTEKTQKLMQVLGISEQEALELQETDKRIDKGEKLFELPDELKAGAKKARQADRKPTAYNFTKRERKPDEVKRGLIELLSTVIQEQPACTFMGVSNPEREFTFMWNGKKYKITLSAPRS